MHFKQLKTLALPPLPETATSIRDVVVAHGSRSVQLLFQQPHRRFYLVQNLSTTDELRITSTQSQPTGEIIGPTGAKLIDANSETTLWGVNNDPTSANAITVSVEEIVGYSPLELATLQALVAICENLEAIRGLK